MSYCTQKSWDKLIKRYADGRPICNCGEAYCQPVGVGAVCKGGVWEDITDLLVCQYGCSANQLTAKEEVATRVLEELN